ncbi:MAG TPA: TlyA family rRNA (cytidine-2'-O)-methyltransferase [Cyanobacteria bacterium UBA11149]|nr:TlyA family rRNA (cytidine-2'-O)-methyltransferase [Cyanobacteria bacterium UBA11367]HBE56193.1 TlyA family rRNA (cytidine-2'-O)-methyltransferase [Cyanobacteria bacterium UBA11366]HBK62141.1 TlyA family rRNA (cytidine-2'-O)-methyltransferase [Cyanobacteria bacterium UBA11166]HBR75281.1 TlyA family rRNA (cytidine-2'-O)-methyltransferase [Cyanobacteria bacterium UBA11159]HBS68789.1 TlyA family rRNA (cytidine-2'-O)-methyltransferase [Cyanobacteria bacterium UBA11153]HBW91726.1 TlyA family rRN
MSKQRLDTLLVELNLCSSRQEAQRLIRAGEVMVKDQVIDKPGTEIQPTAEIKIKERSPYVSRGGEKLAKALKLFQIPVEGRICLDGGISTGGFTDCLLQAGGKLVYGIDVGYGQVAWSLRNNPRVILKERTNIRYLKPEDLYGNLPQSPEGEMVENGLYPDLGVVDVSFISLTKILLPLWHLLQPPREIVLLVKPQFEVGRNRVGKKGVVRDGKDRADAIVQVLTAAQNQGWLYKGLTFSPITGPAGNIEYLLWMGMESQTPTPDLAKINEIAQSAV